MADYEDWSYVAQPVGGDLTGLLTELGEKLETGDLSIEAVTKYLRVLVTNLPADYPDSAVLTELGSILTELEAKLETADLSIDAQKHLQVDVLSGGGGADPATAANQATEITALEKIDDLRNALESVGLDRLVVAGAGGADTVAIYNVTMTNANTEYSQALPANVRRFMIKCRTNDTLKLAFISGQSGTNYINLPGGMNYWEDGVEVPSLTLYFQCTAAGKVAEIVAWS